jgi:cobalt-zinc-cadmium efflux system membrane fusion protein
MSERSIAKAAEVGTELPRRKQLLIVLIVGLAVGAVLAVWRLGFAQSSGPAVEPKAEARVAGALKLSAAQMASLRIAPVATVRFRTERGTEGKIALNGDHATPVFSPYSGRVTRVLANVGDQVRQNQALLAIEASEFVQAQNDLIAAVNGLNTARSQLNLAQGNEQRKHALLDAKGGSVQDWQQSEADLVAAQNSVRSAEAVLAAVRYRLRILGKSEQEVESLESASKIVPVTFVLAPIAGTVTDRQVGVGQYLQAGAANPVYTIGDLSTVWLIGNVREADAPLMRRGLPVEVRVLALPGHVFKAKLTNVAPSVDPNTRRLAVRAEVENPDGALKPEMFASFNVVTGGETLSPAVPDSAVVYEGDAARVWVEQGDAVALRSIRTGRTSHGMVEVLSGLTAGESVVTSGTLFIDRAGRGD